jgi:hypothetical protein
MILFLWPVLFVLSLFRPRRRALILQFPCKAVRHV